MTNEENRSVDLVDNVLTLVVMLSSLYVVVDLVGAVMGIA